MSDLDDARQAVSRFATEAVGCVDGDLVALLCDELVVNALEHGNGGCEIVARPSASGVRVEVHDESRRGPTLRQPNAGDEHGWGLWLVDRYAAEWGTAPLPGDGKVVWFEAESAATL